MDIIFNRLKTGDMDIIFNRLKRVLYLFTRYGFTLPKRPVRIEYIIVGERGNSLFISFLAILFSVFALCPVLLSVLLLLLFDSFRFGIHSESVFICEK